MPELCLVHAPCWSLQATTPFAEEDQADIAACTVKMERLPNRKSLIHGHSQVCYSGYMWNVIEMLWRLLCEWLARLVSSLYPIRASATIPYDISTRDGAISDESTLVARYVVNSIYKLNDWLHVPRQYVCM
jgi:hypothetical protein